MNVFDFILGTSENDSSGFVPFTIEWVPDILPQSKFGELTLHFQFGHQRHPSESITERPIGKRATNGGLGHCGSLVSSVSRRKKPKVINVPDSDPKDLQNLNNIELDFDGVAPLNDSEFQELTKSVP